MTTRTAERIDDWESRPFSDGYAGLRDLADASFSGVVVAGRATCCLLNGTVVGVLDGTIEDFEDATGTIREAPSPALPLLLLMEERSDEVRARYYSEDTPLSEANQKLSDGGFTGYVELSENVLSGDYYVVYHGGRSMSVAFVGESENLLTDEEAFETADDEIGIYKVYPVDIEPIDIPDPEPEPEPTTAGVAAADSDTEETPTESEPEPAVSEQSEPSHEATENSAEHGAEPSDTEPEIDEVESETDESEETPAAAATTERSRESDDPQETPESSPDTTAGGRQDGQSTANERVDDDHAEPTPERTDRSQTARTSHRAEPTDGHEQPPRERQDRTDQSRAESHQSTTGTTEQSRDERTARGSSESDTRRTDPLAESDPIASEEPDDGAIASGEPSSLEHRSIPSVDPDQTWTADEDDPTTATQTTFEPADFEPERTTPESQSPATPARQSEPEPSGRQDRSQRSQTAEQQGQSAKQSPDLVAELREKEEAVESLEEELAVLEGEREDLAAEKEELQTELRQVRQERDDLAAEVEQLRATVADLEAQLEADGPASAAAGGVTLSPSEAIDQTNLFVRYGSKGEATLEAAHDGNADREAVNANLDLEYHTQFDAADTVVDGEAFESFLTGSIQYQFVDWVVHDLLYEIRDTGHASALRDLFDALPRLDRAELNGSVSITFVEDGEEHRTQQRFDVVLRDRMGNPLAVANINDSREAATDGMMSSLVTDSTKVGESSDSLAGAFLVTSSFFDPGALETASEATGGGLLSRDKRESFVRLSRKQGFHLCLVEARDEKFHLAVPEL